jgi:ubiquinone/menaquinone biosynthesis C-methylase UbiE
MTPRWLERYLHDRFVAHYDDVMRPLERRFLRDARDRVLARAEGRVLDLGAGTGANFSRLAPRARSIVALDPDARMLARALPKASGHGAPVAVAAGSAERLPFRTGAFDTVVATLVFCTIAEPELALAEVVRVLRPGGRLLMLEHVRSSNRALAALQSALTPLQRLVAAGCHLDRATPALVDRGGLRTTRIRERFASILVEIEAVRA